MEKVERQDYSLEWKKHDEFFTSLNRKLDEISLVGELCYKDISNIYDYFAKIKNLYNKHKAYVQNPKLMKEDLDKIQNALYDMSFLKDLQHKTPQAHQFRLKIFSKLQEVLTQMIEDFTIPELIPKPIKAEKLISQATNLSDDEREEFEALEEIGIKYRIIE